jgi:hypothetical protein
MWDRVCFGNMAPRIRTRQYGDSHRWFQLLRSLAAPGGVPLVDYFALACVTDSRTILVLNPWMGLNDNPFALASFFNSR